MTDLPPPQPPLCDRVTVPNTYQEQKVTPTSHLDYGTLTVTLMSSGDSPASDASQVSIETEQTFRSLAERWYLDTMPLSSYIDKILHPAYQKILTLADEAVPLILRELQDQPNDWFWALRILTDDDPVSPNDAGDMVAMTNAWLRWGTDKGYI